MARQLKLRSIGVRQYSYMSHAGLDTSLAESTLPVLIIAQIIRFDN